MKKKVYLRKPSSLSGRGKKNIQLFTRRHVSYFILLNSNFVLTISFNISPEIRYSVHQECITYSLSFFFFFDNFCDIILAIKALLSPPLFIVNFCINYEYLVKSLYAFSDKKNQTELYGNANFIPDIIEFYFLSSLDNMKKND